MCLTNSAKALSDPLSKLGCEHVYIGGFAWVLLGSNRPAEISGRLSCHRISCLCSIYDLDVLVQPKDLDIQALPSKLCELNKDRLRR